MSWLEFEISGGIMMRKVLFMVFLFTLSIGMNGCGQPITALVEGAKEQVEDHSSGDLVTLKQATIPNSFVKMVVQTNTADIRLVRSEGKEVQVNLNGDKKIFSQFEFDAEIQGDTLYVKAEELGKIKLRPNFSNRELVIKLPMGIAAELKSDVGSITSEEVEFTGPLSVETDSGDVELRLPKMTNDLNVLTSVGDVHVLVNESASSAYLDLASDLGNVQANIGSVKYEKHTKNQVKGMIGSNGPQIFIRANIGNINLETY
jgi:hypothetical protein